MNERLKHLLKAVKGSDGQQNGKTTKNRRKRINLSELTNFLDWNERREDTEKSEQTENIIKSNPFYCAKARKVRFYHFHSESRRTFSSMKSAQLRTFGLLRRKLCVKRENRGKIFSRPERFPFGFWKWSKNQPRE